jgi:hypothetical protein
MIHKDKKDLRGTNVLKYIREGESKGYHLRPTCASRERWYDLGEKEPGSIGWPYMLRERIFAAFNPNSCFLDCEFFDLYPQLLPITMLGVLNSSPFALIVEILSRSYGGGGGPLKIQVYELMGMAMLDPTELNGALKDELEESTLEISKRPLSDIFSELGASSLEEVSIDKVKPDRRALDKIVMGEILGLTDEEQLEVYRAVVDLVKSRIEKAKSFGKRHKTKEGIDIDLLVKTVMEKLGDDTLGKYYREKILSHSPLRTRTLPRASGEVKLEQELFGWRLCSGREHIDCASEIEARYLKVWLEAGLENVKTPKDEAYLSEIVPELENLKQKTDDVFEDYLGSILDPRLRQRLLHQLWQEAIK